MVIGRLTEVAVPAIGARAGEAPFRVVTRAAVQARRVSALVHVLTAELPLPALSTIADIIVLIDRAGRAQVRAVPRRGDLTVRALGAQAIPIVRAVAIELGDRISTRRVPTFIRILAEREVNLRHGIDAETVILASVRKHLTLVRVDVTVLTFPTGSWLALTHVRARLIDALCRVGARGVLTLVDVLPAMDAGPADITHALVGARLVVAPTHDAGLELEALVDVSAAVLAHPADRTRALIRTKLIVALAAVETRLVVTLVHVDITIRALPAVGARAEIASVIVQAFPFNAGVGSTLVDVLTAEVTCPAWSAHALEPAV